MCSDWKGTSAPHPASYQKYYIFTPLLHPLANLQNPELFSWQVFACWLYCWDKFNGMRLTRHPSITLRNDHHHHHRCCSRGLRHECPTCLSWVKTRTRENSIISLSPFLPGYSINVLMTVVLHKEDRIQLSNKRHSKTHFCINLISSILDRNWLTTKPPPSIHLTASPSGLVHSSVCLLIPEILLHAVL